MKNWYGYRVVELDGSNPGSKCVEGPFDSYDAAKLHKQKMRAKDMEQTAIFMAQDQSEAEEMLNIEQFSKL